MFRELRRKNQALSPADCAEILTRNTAGVLAVSGDDGYPYAVPLSYVYHDGKILFHSAKAGHKLDAIGGNEKVSFCVIDADQVVPAEYTTYFRSVIVFGKAHVLENEAEKRAALETLGRRYSPEEPEAHLAEEIDKSLDRVTMIALTIDHISGKQAKELVKGRK